MPLRHSFSDFDRLALSHFCFVDISAACLLQHAMIQECARAGCLKKNNISHLSTIETGRLNKVRARKFKRVRNSRHGAFELDAANWSWFILPGATPDVTQQLLHSPATLLSVPAFSLRSPRGLPFCFG